jgi:transcriptional regulator with XRE-family HTH domain/tetratricopeptide (TPR) repeat protein
MPNDDIPPGAILAVLRIVRGWSQLVLAQAAGMRSGTISEYERGKKPLPLRTLERLAAVMGYSAATIERARAFIQEARSTAGPVQPEETLSRQIDAFAADFGRAYEDFARTWLSRFVSQTSALETRTQAPFLWQRLRRYKAKERLGIVEKNPELQSWGLCELICEESVKAAAGDAGKALELAELALRIAKRVPGAEGRLAQGWAWAFVGNARRVGGNLPAADEAFARSRELWGAGTSGDPGFLDESRLLDLEASLRRDQRRLPETLDLLDRASANAKGPAAARILVQMAKTAEELDDYPAALETLRRAASVVDSEDEPLLFSIRHNLVAYLVVLGRHGEAARLLPEVRQLAIRLGNDLNLVRLRWLEARVSASMGQIEEAIAALRQVRGEFATRGIAYDTALATLELAVLLAEQGRAREVKDLARQMAFIFKAQGVHREALAALSMFRRAAEEETVTAELARSVLDFLQRARHDPALRFTDSRSSERWGEA